MRRLIVLTALGLCACGGEDKNPNAPVAKPDVAGNFAQPIDARGGEPAWGLTIRGTQLRLSRPNEPDLAGAAPGAEIKPHAASWTAALPDGRAMKVSLYASPCTEPATGVTYPFAAEVQLPGAAPLDGCGGPPARPPASR